MKGKSLVVAIFSILIAVIASYSNLLPVHLQGWIGIVSFTLTLLLASPFLKSGSYPAGWTPVLIITNIVGIAVQVLGKIGDDALVNPAVINYVILGINILMTGFIKDYGKGSILNTPSLVK